MKFLNIFAVLFAGLIALQSCDTINPAEDIPTYLHIDTFSFQPTPGTGTSSHKITSVWVYFEGQTVGAFDLPVTVPVLTNKPGQIVVIPGVTYSGLQDVQTPYRHYTADTMTLQPLPGQVVNFAPGTQYLPDTVLSIMNVDFETGNPFYKVDGDTALTITSDPDYVFEGDYASLIKFDKDTQFYSLNLLQTEFQTGDEPFLEINYRNSLPFQIGIQTTNASGQTVVQYLLGLNPRDNWNKVYIGLQDIANAYPNRSYRILVRVLTETPQNGFVALDNVKVISIK